MPTHSTTASGTLMALAGLFKLRIGLAIALSAVAGLAVAAGPQATASDALLIALAVLLASAAAGAFNQYVERDLDARMRRTANRPFVTGRWQAGPLWLAVILVALLLGVGLALVAFNAVAAIHVFLGAFVYGVVYTVWLKRRTWWNIVVGGLAGSFAVLAGAAAVTPTPGSEAIILAVVLFLWTPPHFWSLALALRDDYAAAGVPMLPVVVGPRRCAQVILAHSVTLSVLALLPVAFGLGPLYLAAALFGGTWLIASSLRLLADPCTRRARSTFHASLIQLSLLLLGAIGDVWLPL